MRLAACLIMLAGPVIAQSGVQTFDIPQDCDAFLTVQGTSCTVDHHFVCQADPDGHQRRVRLDEQGVTYAGVIDDEAQWISSFHPLAGLSERLEDEPAERASLSTLIKTGVDNYDFRTLSDRFGATRFVGQDTLTGRIVEIDGVTLEETTYDITAFDEAGNELWSSAGREFINRDWRMFLSGTGTTVSRNGSFDKNDVPVEFIYPGERGFLSAQPKHGCGVAISSADILKETSHDNL